MSSVKYAPAEEQEGKGEEEAEEAAPFLGTEDGYTMDAKPKGLSERRRWKLYIILGVILVLLIASILLLTACKGSRIHSVVEDLIHPKSSHSVVKKVTGHYGKGFWYDDPNDPTNMKLMYKRSLRLHQEHSKIHGHEQVIAKIQLFGQHIDNAYTKIGNLLEHNLQELSKEPASRHVEWLFWHDADTVITNRMISLDSLIANVKEDESVQMIYAKDTNHGFNAGVFFLRVSEWTSIYLSSVLALAKAPNIAGWDLWEQGAMIRTLEGNPFFLDSIVQVPNHWFNIYPNLTSIDHVEGQKSKQRESLKDERRPGLFQYHLAGKYKHEPGWFDYLLRIGEGHDEKYHNQQIADQLAREADQFWKDRSAKVLPPFENASMLWWPSGDE